ncbi:MAG: A/G-specific adenine glycosylase [Burkholderiales bacterium]
MSGFVTRLIRWQKRHGRHDLPWQRNTDPYAVWVSEIMLQQTQVATVIPYYERFMVHFPDTAALARASQQQVLECWSGLGYYSRARNLHRAAQYIVERHGGVFPHRFEDMLALPGIGRTTAAAIAVFALGKRCAILDGNVKRVLSRYFGVAGHPGEKQYEDRLWQQAEALLPRRGIRTYTQALMDVGAALCTRARPECAACPLCADCYALREGLTEKLPQPRPRRPLPQKQVVMLMLLHEGEVFLEKRPPSGIWGGMWSFPEAEPGVDLALLCEQRYGVCVNPLQALPGLEHGFSHFKLRITPQPLAVVKPLTRVSEQHGVWLATRDAMGAAIPAPVRKLLRQLL